jgi:hypothetical protein
MNACSDVEEDLSSWHYTVQAEEELKVSQAQEQGVASPAQDKNDFMSPPFGNSRDSSFKSLEQQREEEEP